MPYYGIDQKCVICLQNSDCPGKEVCDQTTKTCVEGPPELQATYKAIGTVLQGAVASTTPLMGVNPTILWSLMKLFQGLYYFLFFNVKYPDNLKGFFGMFNIAKFPFLPNVGDKITFGDLDVPSPAHFYENEYPGYFLKAAGSTVFLWGIIIVSWVISKLMSMFTIGRIGKLFKKTEFYISGQLIPDTWDSSGIELLYAALLQMLQISFSRPALSASSIFSMMILIIVAVVIVWKAIIISRKKRTEPKIEKWLPLIDLVKRTGQPFIMVFFYYYPFQQLAGMWTLSGAYCAILIFAANVKNHKIDIIQEVAHFFVFAAISFLIYDEVPGSRQDTIGLMTIVLCSIIIAVQLINAVYVSIVELILRVKKLWQKSRKSKIKKISRIEAKYLENPPPIHIKSDKVLLNEPKAKKRRILRRK